MYCDTRTDVHTYMQTQSTYIIMVRLIVVKMRRIHGFTRAMFVYFYHYRIKIKHHWNFSRFLLCPFRLHRPSSIFPSLYSNGKLRLLFPSSIFPSLYSNGKLRLLFPSSIFPSLYSNGKLV